VNADKQHVAIKKLGDHGKPGSPGHAVELEVTVSRRDVFKIIVPFLVASIALGAQNGDELRGELPFDDD
jgi:hypothetical protein